MAEEVFINASARSLADAVVDGRKSMQPVGLKGLVVGEQRTYKVFLVDGEGAFDSRSGNSSFDLRLGIGELDRSLTGGKWQLEWTSPTPTTDTSAEIAHDATAAEVQTALEAHSDIAAGDVLVLGTNPVFRVEFQGSYADTDVNELTVKKNTLEPDASIKISTVRTGGGGDNERQLVRLVPDQRIIIPPADWSTITDGFQATVDTITKDFAELLAGAARKITGWNLEIQDSGGDPEVLATKQITVRNTF